MGLSKDSRLPGEVIVEGRHNVDSGVMLGYPTGRSIPSTVLRIGPDAKIRSGTAIYAGSTIGPGLETGHNVVIREQNEIGEDFTIWSNSVVDYGCRIGNHVRLHCNVYVAQFTLIEDEVFMAPGVTIANDPHPVCGLCMEDQAPRIRRGARIGINVTILPGVEIGESALIGAGSVVTHSIPPRAVAYGNPARVVTQVDELTCPLEIVKRPYQQGMDVDKRSELGYPLD